MCCVLRYFVTSQKKKKKKKRFTKEITMLIMFVSSSEVSYFTLQEIQKLKNSYFFRTETTKSIL